MFFFSGRFVGGWRLWWWFDCVVEVVVDVVVADAQTDRAYDIDFDFVSEVCKQKEIYGF